MKQAARLVLLAGAVAIGLFLFRAAPRDVTLVYALDPPAPGLVVEVLRGAEVVRRAEFTLGASPPAQVRHEVKLTDGDYLLRLTVRGPAGERRAEKPITVSESGTIVVPVDAR
jgi:hypothetical protein